MSLLLSVVLSAALLEPNPPKDARRLQPRQVSASSFLKNGWNRAEQNYLPPYVADDNADTAWVEGVPGFGEGQSLTWLGPTLAQVKQFRIFIRNGYQKSRALHAANGRPKRIQLQPLLKTEVTEVDVGRPITVTLSDALGWQEVVLPTAPHVTGFRLTVRSVYPGAKYQDTAISDVRVYVEGDDKYNAAAELASMEGIRKFVEERARAAALQGDEGSIELAPSYRVEVLRAPNPSGPSTDERMMSFSELAKAHQGDAFKERWKQVWEIARAMDAIEPFAQKAAKEVTTGAPAGWTRVTARPRHAKPSAAAVALGQSPDHDLSVAVAYLATKDILLFQDTTTPAQLQGRVEAAKKQEKADEAWCKKSAEAWAASAQKSAIDEDSAMLLQKFYEDHSSRCEHLMPLDIPPPLKSEEVAAEIHGGSFVKGGFENPSQLLVLNAFYLSDRNFAGQMMPRILVAYEGNLASLLATSDPELDKEEGEDPLTFIHLLEWKDLGKGRHELVGITSVSPQGTWRLTAVD